MKNIKSHITLLLITFCFACGGEYIEEPTPTFSKPSITNISVSNQNGSPITRIEWHFPAYEEPIIKGFKIERAENNGDFSELKSDISSNLRFFEFPESFRGGKVSFRVSTLGEKSGQTSLVESYFAPVSALPNTCTTVSSTQVQSVGEKPVVYLNWSLNPNSTAYRGTFQVLRATPNSPAFLLIATTNNSNFTDDKIEFGQSYLYSIRLAQSNCPSNLVTTKIVRNPAGLCPGDFTIKTINENNKKTVLMSWDAQLSNFSSFTVKRANVEGGEFLTLKENLQTTVFHDTEILKPNTSYFYKIVGFVNSQPPNTCETNVLEVKF